MRTLGTAIVMMMWAVFLGYAVTWILDAYAAYRDRKRTISVSDQILIGRSITRMK